MLRFMTVLLILMIMIASAQGGELHDAAMDGDPARTQQLIDDGADINAKGPDGATPLILASLEGHRDVIELMLANGASIQGRNKGGLTALHAATYRGHDELVNLLIARGADVNDADNRFKVSPLHMAAEENYPDIIQLLVDNGADITATEVNGWTPLTRSVFKEHAGVIVLFRRLGARCQSEELLGEYYHDMCTQASN